MERKGSRPTQNQVERARIFLRELSLGDRRITDLAHEHAIKAENELAIQTGRLLDVGAFPLRRAAFERDGKILVEDLPLLSLGSSHQSEFPGHELFADSKGEIFYCTVNLAGIPLLDTRIQVDSQTRIHAIDLAMAATRRAYEDFVK